MWRLLQILFIGLFSVNVLTFGKRDWDYTVLSTFANSSNEDLFSWHTVVTRLERGLYAVSGEIIVNIDIDETFYTECLAYWSSFGNSHFKLLPFAVPKQRSSVFLANTYRRILMPALANCSNAPQSINNQPPELKRGTYVFNKCLVSPERFPSHLQNGFYKVHLLGTSPKVKYFMEIIAEVEPKHFANSKKLPAK